MLQSLRMPGTLSEPVSKPLSVSKPVPVAVHESPSVVAHDGRLYAGLRLLLRLLRRDILRPVRLLQARLGSVAGETSTYRSGIA